MFKAIQIIRELKNKYHDTFMQLADSNHPETLRMINKKIETLDEVLELLYKERDK